MDAAHTPNSPLGYARERCPLGGPDYPGCAPCLREGLQLAPSARCSADHAGHRCRLMRGHDGWHATRAGVRWIADDEQVFADVAVLVRPVAERRARKKP